MIAAEVVECMQRSFARVDRWYDRLAPEERALLRDAEVVRDISRRSYIDAYWRVCETTPLILATIAALNRAQEREAAEFWAVHLREELGHDTIHREDLARMYGPADLEAVLAGQPMTPPSVAVIAYFRGNIDRGAPHMLMIYRLFLELFTANMKDAGRELRQRLGEDASRSVELHCELDVGHVEPCQDYLDRHFTVADRGRLLWSVGFVTECLIQSQLYLARPLLERP